MGIELNDDARDPELPFQSMQGRYQRQSPIRGGVTPSPLSPITPPAVASSTMPPLASPPAKTKLGFTLQKTQCSTPISPAGPSLPQPSTIPVVAASASPRSQPNSSASTKGTIGQRRSRPRPSTSLALGQSQIPLASPKTAVIPVVAQSTPLPTSPHSTIWVQCLVWFHRSVGVATVALVLTALGFYGQSVYYQQRWGQHYRQLQRLKTLEHQGIAANEIMKYNLLEQATHPSLSMQMPLPGTAIPVQQVPPRPLRTVEPLDPIQNMELDAPTGY
ncbi:MAG: hypothetical protein AB4042_13490 [Leptolyngbyaceae cyanobacterium]